MTSINMPHLPRRRTLIVFECNPVGNKRFPAGLSEYKSFTMGIWYDMIDAR